MTLGTMTWTCLLLTAGAAQPDVFNMNQRAFQIPIHFDAQRRAEIRELDLYVSHDQGQTWNMEGKATPEKEFFPYTAKDDGAYWFTVAIIDQKGRQEPVNILTAPVGQRIMVDTVKPEIELNADRQGEEIRVNWRITELHPNPATLKLEYGETADGPWTSLPITPGPTGEAKFTNPAAVVVRIQMQDMAENVGQAVKQVAASVTNVAFAPPPGGLGSTPPPPTPGFVPPPPVPVVAPPTPASDVPIWNPRPADPVPVPVAVHTAPPPAPPALPTPNPVGDVYPMPAPAGGAQVVGSSQIPVAPKETGNQRVAFSSPQAPLGPNATYGGQDAPATSHSGMPPLQIVNKKQVKLEFDVDKFGPSGLGGVDVYVTTDDGATWQVLNLDAGATVLPPVDARAGAVRGSVTVPLVKEGVAYGYWVVVKSRAGLGKSGPHANDPPQIRIELDVTPPEATLLRPQADPARRDTLVLMWEATDKNLTNKPISLEWCDHPGPDAQWHFIGPEELPNTGRFDWQPPSDIAPNVYLRLTARDTAGNKAVAQTPKPVLIDLIVPEVSNLNLGGVSLGVGPR
jgi:hypothetical protein